MTAKEFLSQYQILKCEIDAGYEKLEKLNAIAQKSTSCGKIGGNRAVYDRVGIVSAEIADLSREIEQKNLELVRTLKNIEMTINAVNNRRLRLILMHYYILGKTHEQTAEKIGVSDRQEKRLHKKAVEEADKILFGKN